MVRLIFQSLQLQTIIWRTSASGGHQMTVKIMVQGTRESTVYEFEARKRKKGNKVGCMVGRELGSTLTRERVSGKS